MKFGLIVSTMLLLSTAAFSNEKCAVTAEKAVLKKYARHFITNGKVIRAFTFHSCSAMSSSQGNKYVKCDLTAVSVDGSLGPLDFSALMSADCNRSFAQFILAEE